MEKSRKKNFKCDLNVEEINSYNIKSSPKQCQSQKRNKRSIPSANNLKHFKTLK